MSPFASAIQQAMSSVRAVAGVAVTYCRGDLTVAVSAVPGSTTFEESSFEDAANIGFTSSDWIFRCSDLLLGGQQITPRRGDQVRVTDPDGGTTRVYEALTDGTQVFRYCD